MFSKYSDCFLTWSFKSKTICVINCIAVRFACILIILLFSSWKNKKYRLLIYRVTNTALPENFQFVFKFKDIYC